jgi:DNA-binding GntR family transcriptional regulator
VLAKALGVSRTPLREALRMLQEEGLIEAEPNRRSRVTGFDPADLDSVYASRVALESLGVALTRRRPPAADHQLLRPAGRRYLRIAQQWHARTWWAVDGVQHQVILDAARGRRRDVAATQVARHLARTALAVMADVAPEREPVAVRAALQMLEGLMAVDRPEGLAQYPARRS